jgi:hypothetical protein
MLNKLSKNYSRTLLAIFIVAGTAPVIARTLPEAIRGLPDAKPAECWAAMISYLFSILAIVANTMISFFTDTQTPAPEAKPPTTP